MSDVRNLLPLLILWLWAAPVAAYVLPGYFVVEQAERASRDRAGLTVQYAISDGPGPARVIRVVVEKGMRFPQAPASVADVLGKLVAGEVTAVTRQTQVDTGLQALSRFDGRVAVTVGADRRRVDAPQLWIDKDSFVVLRLKTRAYDIQLLGTHGPLSKVGLPERIQIVVASGRRWSARLQQPPSR